MFLDHSDCFTASVAVVYTCLFIVGPYYSVSREDIETDLFAKESKSNQLLWFF
jgi:hypothetical protein